jgi:hypothetical protein
MKSKYKCITWLYVFAAKNSATHVLCDCKAIAYLRFRHLGQFFMEPSDYCDTSVNKVLYFIKSVGLIKGWSKGEAQQSLKVAVQGLSHYGPPLIHSFLLLKLMCPWGDISISILYPYSVEWVPHLCYWSY